MAPQTVFRCRMEIGTEMRGECRRQERSIIIQKLFFLRGLLHTVLPGGTCHVDMRYYHLKYFWNSWNKKSKREFLNRVSQVTIKADSILTPEPFCSQRSLCLTCTCNPGAFLWRRKAAFLMLFSLTCFPPLLFLLSDTFASPRQTSPFIASMWIFSHTCVVLRIAFYHITSQLKGYHSIFKSEVI